MNDPLPGGDFAAGLALLKQSEQPGAALSEVAGMDRTVQLASHEGLTTAKAASTSNGSTTSTRALPPLKALHAAVRGMVAGNRTGTSPEVPRLAHPALALHAESDMAHLVGQRLHQVAHETLTQMSGQDNHLTTGGQLRLHTGLAIDVLAKWSRAKAAVAVAAAPARAVAANAAPTAIPSTPRA